MGAIPIKNLVPGVGVSEVLSLNGAPVAATNEIQTITITGTPTGGTFTLTVLKSNGQSVTTAPIAYNANAAAVAAALNAVLGASSVSGGGGALPGTPATATFSGNGYAARNVPQMTANGAALTGGASPTVAVTTTTPGVPPTLAGKWPKGGLGVDTVNTQTYQNTGTTAIPVPTKVGTQS